MVQVMKLLLVGRGVYAPPPIEIDLLLITTLDQAQHKQRYLAPLGKRECAIRLPGFCDGRVVISCGANDTAIEDEKLRVSPEESIANVGEISSAEPKKNTKYL